MEEMEEMVEEGEVKIYLRFNKQMEEEVEVHIKYKNRWRMWRKWKKWWSVNKKL